MSLLDPPPALDDPVFREPWEASAFALVLSLHQRGLFSWSEWAAALAEVVAADQSKEPVYYAQWLAALETIIQRKNIASQRDIERVAGAWHRAAEATPHGLPIELENDPLGRAS